MKKRVLSLLLTLVMIVGMLPTAMAAKPTFTDVKKGDWCYDYVEFVAKNGYFKGTTATTFNPNGTMTRQQFVTVLARMAGVKVDNSKSAFTDVPAGSYSAGSVAWAAKEGIVAGYADGTFKPTDPVTRQQMCAFMARFMDYYAKANNVQFLKKGKLESFKDDNLVSAYAKDAVDLCRTYGLILGYASDNTFRPLNTASRAHVAAVIERLALLIQKVGGGGGPVTTPPVITPVDENTFTLKYYNTNVADGVNTYYTNDGPYTVQDIDNYTFYVKEDPTALNNKFFVNWSDSVDADETYSYGDPITLTVAADQDSAEKTLKANWGDNDDLLYYAVGMTRNYIDARTPAKIAALNTVGRTYVTLGAMTIATPDTIDTADNSRDITIAASAELNSDIISRIIETATYYAVRVIGSDEYIASSSAANNPSALTKADVRTIVGELLDILDPTQTWWEGEGRRARLEALADKIYETLKTEGKSHGSLLWNNYYKYEGKPIVTAVALKDGATTLLVAKSDKKLYEADGTTALSLKKGAARVAKTVAQKLYGDLMNSYTSADTYYYDIELEGTLSLAFTMNDAEVPYENGTAGIDEITAGYPTTYHVAAKVNLSQDDDILGYRFYNGENYVKLNITTEMQADYAESVDTIAKAAMTNPTLKNELITQLKKALKDFVYGNSTVESLATELKNYNAYLAGDFSTVDKAKDHIYNQLLGRNDVTPKTGVYGWVEDNLSTADRGTIDYPANAAYYLPFDFFWNQATAEIVGDKAMVNGAEVMLGNHEMLIASIEQMIGDVTGAVADAKYDEYDLDPNNMEASIKTKLNDQIDNSYDMDALRASVIAEAKAQFNNMLFMIEDEARKAARDAWLEAHPSATTQMWNDLWNNLDQDPSKTVEEEQHDLIRQYLDVEGIMYDLFGCTTAAGLTTIDQIDKAACYTAKTGAGYDADIEQMKVDTSDTIYSVIVSETTGRLNLMLASQEQMIQDMVNQTTRSKDYLRELVLGKLGFDEAFNVNRVIDGGQSLENTALAQMADWADDYADQAIEDARNDMGLSADEIERLLNTAVVDAAGIFGDYLNEIKEFKTIKALADEPLQKLINVVNDNMVKNIAKEKAAPKYLNAIAKAIGKIENNPSSLTIDGKVVNASSLNGIKNAADGKELCEAVAAFLTPWKDLTINNFAPDTVNRAEDGIEVIVDASAKGYHYDFVVNFVIEIAQ